MCVLAESNVRRRVSEESRESLTDFSGALRGVSPFLVHELRGVEPRPLLGLERFVGPSLM